MVDYRRVNPYLVAHPTARKWVITPVTSGLTLLIPSITGVVTHLLSGMSHQVHMGMGQKLRLEEPSSSLRIPSGKLT